MIHINKICDFGPLFSSYKMCQLIRIHQLVILTTHHQQIDCVGVIRHVNPCGSFCVVSQRKGEETEEKVEEKVEEMKERDREERGTGVKYKKQMK